MLLQKICGIYSLVRIHELEEMFSEDGETCNICYDYEYGVLCNFEELIDLFELKKNDVIVFNPVDNNFKYAKVYQHDVMEIDYSNCAVKNATHQSNEIFWRLTVCLTMVSAFACY